MPNWVANRISITGSDAELDRFVEQAGREPATFTAHAKFYDSGEEKGEWRDPISFANFICPPQEALDSGEYWATHGFSKGEESGNTPNNWYNFNIREWDTKWDACHPEVERTDEGVAVAFETAWSPPEPIFRAMAEQFPELEFDIWWEEEQGFGAELLGTGGELTLVKEWDIPSSHADYVTKDGDGENCVCSHETDKEYWYDDCPNKRDIFVRVTKVYRLTANGVEEARTEYFEMQNGSKELPEEEDGLTSYTFTNADGEQIED